MAPTHLSLPDLDQVRRRLDAAQTPALLMLVAQATGDTSLLRPEWRPDPLALPFSGLPEEVDRAIREHALSVLESLADQGGSMPARPTREVLRGIAEWITGPLEEDEVSLLDGVLVMDDEDPDAPDWDYRELAGERPVRVAIIGAGISGLLGALRMKQAGVPFVIFERAEDLGGTWYQNTYPDCRIDVPSHIYTYSFVPSDWPSYFCRQEAILHYLQEFAKAEGLVEHIRFGTEVVSAQWDAEEAAWQMRLRDQAGERVESFTAVASAVGQLNRPAIPDIPGRETFAGPAFHSAEWDHGVDLTDRRVVVIGTGASALQFAPAVADAAAHVTVLQRTPPWLQPTPELRRDIGADERWLLSELPTYRGWYRFSIFLPKLRGNLEAATVDPDYPPTERAVSAANDALRETLTTYLTDQMVDRPDLVGAVVPAYPPASKRIVRDDGTWIRFLSRDDVDLVSDPIERIVPEGVVLRDGRLIEADVLLWGTGFKASEFLMPMSVVGEDGRDLHSQWDGDAAAYMGVAIPGFPNFFTLFGPNTSVLVHANLVYFIERQVRYFTESIRLLLETGATSLCLREEIFEEHQRELVAANAQRAWGWSSVSSWYKNAHGRSPIMWPLSTADFWRGTRVVDPAHYVLRHDHPIHHTKEQA
ncbi:flavin-containing monooxygenase [Nocardioides acrostichi]|uniref:NAD(P)/FAD-dependent oxidoreductase n=1 Tax=Nocardioides acrostichi TaxID=2784339 RepID=A0A930Y714_9ACTN|nr:NAD(P)/FAD-dependent oxidoreductase [Nocardioides acrostichi]MBF4161572.1 NAD(P)/FAD-dependent oxidoreductase [Nocardioides acrostichi]